MLQLRKDSSGMDGGDAGSALALEQAANLLQSATSEPLAPFSRWRTSTGERRDLNLAERLLLTALACDTVVVAYALLGAFWLRFRTPLGAYGTPAVFSLQEYAGYIAFGAFSLIGTMTYFGVYDRRRLLRYRHTGERIVKACLMWFMGFLSVSLMFKFQPQISRGFVVLCALNAVAGLLAWRYAFHRFLQHSKAAASLRQRVVFVGWNEESEKLARSVEADPVHPYEVVGCVPSPGSRFQMKPTVPVLGDYSNMGAIFAEQGVDMVMLADLDCVKGEIVGLANLCEREMVQFKIVPSYFQILVSGLHLETVSGVPVLGVSQLPLDLPLNFLLKRMVDIVGASIGLVLSAPLIAFFGLMVWLESGGPIFYRHTRMGRGGQPFDIIKIRSMKLNADKEGGFWTVKNDPRRLRVGAFMRAWNLDELPQFWNVLKGEMSLVGPRPESVELIANFRDEVPHYNARHNAKPGITGWAQIKGLRGDTDLGERIRADLYYLENWNVLLDFQIMALTFRSRRNAH
jgi:exopolysaccharide biosynthesis polyprenyl glycosylphosphotransferase